MSFWRREWEKHGQPVTAEEIARTIIRETNDLCPKRFFALNYRALSDEDMLRLIKDAAQPDPPWERNEFVCWGFAVKRWGEVMAEWARKARHGTFVAWGFAQVHRVGDPTDHAMNWWRNDEGRLRWFEPQDNKIVVPLIDRYGGYWA